jgi:hypothetical protein
MATHQYRAAEAVFGWSFYRQGTSGDASSADEFLDAALAWFGDPDPRIGTGWEKGERLAKLIALRRALLILGGGDRSLLAEDRLFILMQAALNLSATRGFSTPEARLCYERAELLCRSLDRPLLLYLALIGQWRYSLLTDKLTATMQIAKRVYSLAQQQNVPAFMIGACNALAGTLYCLGDFENARQYALRGVDISHSDDVQSPAEEVDAPGVTCLYFRALSEWHVGEIAASKLSMVEAISLAKELSDKHALILTLYHAAVLGVYQHDPTEVERYTSELIER